MCYFWHAWRKDKFSFSDDLLPGLIPVDFHFMLGKVNARYYFLYRQNIHIYLENPLSINFLPLAPVSYDFVILHQQIFQNITWSGWIYLRAKYMKNEFELSIFEMYLQVECWKGRCTYDALLPSMRWCSFLQWSELSQGNAEWQRKWEHNWKLFSGALIYLKGLAGLFSSDFLFLTNSNHLVFRKTRW